MTRQPPQPAEPLAQRHTRAVGLFVLLLLCGFASALGIETARRPIPQSDAPALSLRYRVDINTADADRLAVLPGIGPTIAQHILDNRRRHGRFTAVDQLTRVNRIGPKTVQGLRPWVRVK